MARSQWAGTGDAPGPHPWLTIAPIHPFWLPDAPLTGAFNLDPDLQLAPLPDWLRDDELLNELSWSNRKKIRKEAHYALIDQYRASVDGEEDPDWQGPFPRSKQARARERLLLANLAFWLAERTNLGYTVVLDFEKPKAQWAPRGSEVYPRLLPHESYRDARFPAASLGQAKKLFAALTRLPRQSNLWPGIRSLWSALTQETWEVRLLLLWVVMESLFGSDNPQETTFRLSLRAALFLAPTRPSAPQLFDEIKKGYAWRSKVAHGMQPNQMRRLTPELSLKLSDEVESYVQRALSRVLLDEKIQATFEDPTRRETFLDGAIFA